MWGWAMTKGVFGSTKKPSSLGVDCWWHWQWSAHWLWPVWSKVLWASDDLQKGAVRSNLWGTGLLLPNIDDLERRWFSTNSKSLLGNGGVVWARFLGRQRGSFLWWSASGILQASRAKGELFWWSAGELSFNLKFLNFQLYFTHTGLEVIDTCAALCSLARTFVILNAPLGFSCFLLDRTLEGGWFVVPSQQNCFHCVRVLLEHNIQNGVFIHYFHDLWVWRCFCRECITQFQFLTELLEVFILWELLLQHNITTRFWFMDSLRLLKLALVLGCLG